VVGEGEVEAATEVFRRLLEQALSEQRRARPGRAPAVHLDVPIRPADRPPAEGGSASGGGQEPLDSGGGP